MMYEFRFGIDWRTMQDKYFCVCRQMQPQRNTFVKMGNEKKAATLLCQYRRHARCTETIGVGFHRCRTGRASQTAT